MKPSRRRGWRLGLAGLLAMPGVAAAEQLAPSGSDFGGIGLLQTRTARFQDDGGISLGASIVDQYLRYYLNVQPLPFLEATFRYTEVDNRDFGGSFREADEESFKDRGADLKLLLLKEGKYRPQVALGLQDGLGTGLFSSEYLVASKRYYDLDFSLGLAWGYLGNGASLKNPFVHFSEAFRARDAEVGRGGLALFSNYFTGDTVGLFGGVSWHTPLDGLVLKLEYDGNDYRSEPLSNIFRQKTPLNVGLVYSPAGFVELSAGLERGNVGMVRLALRGNFKDKGPTKFDAPPPALKIRPKRPPPTGATALPELVAKPGPRLLADPPPVAPRARQGRDVGGDDLAATLQGLFDRLEESGVRVEEVDLGGAEALVHVAIANQAMAAEQADAILAAVLPDLPASIARLTLVQRDNKGLLATVTVDRDAAADAAIVDHLYDDLEARGYRVAQLDMREDEVELVVEAAAGADGDLQQAAASVLAALPVPAQRLIFVRIAGDAVSERLVLSRDDIQRAQRIASLFDGLEASGFDVGRFEIERDRAQLTLTAAEHMPDSSFQVAARLIDEHAPEPLDELTVIGVRAGLETTRFTWRRREDETQQDAAAAGASAGADRAPSPPVRQLSPEARQAIVAAIVRDLNHEGFAVDAVRLDRLRATAFVTPTRFRQTARNIGRAARVLANNAPGTVEELTVVTLSSGLETARVTLMRKDLEAAEQALGSSDEIWAHARFEPPEGAWPPATTTPEDADRNPERYPDFSWSFRPGVAQFVGGREGLLLYQVFISADASLELARGLSIGGAVSYDLFGNFDELNTPSDSQLPRVRSDIQEYLRAARLSLGRLQADYLFQPAPDWFARLSGGIFEQMYGGFSGEVLWRPYGSRLAFGVDINRVRQRDFDQRLAFRDYQVTTGHFNLYYKLPVYDLLFEVHAGQFLAGDRGAQFVLSRRFESGVRAGVWATFTDVPFAVFGEGSFDKGFFVSVPFDVFLPESSRRSSSFGFRPLTRDGGQLVTVGKRLFPLVDVGNVDRIMDDWSRLLE
ncbi:MAG: YjbH domain-containing protein [Alphaproteobacteria bacterium]|nr:YjbH domain-containing protein [Alphaproteobacteria bacterium]